MADPSKVPIDPLAFIQRNVRRSNIFWTYHVSMRLLKRGMTRDQIVGAADTYEVIESYPDDKYLPSYLVFGSDTAGVLHVLFATDIVGDNVRVVTAYRPNPTEWDATFKTRIAP
jgi:Domain of unknown function (DUF4258)